MYSKFKKLTSLVLVMVMVSLIFMSNISVLAATRNDLNSLIASAKISLSTAYSSYNGYDVPTNYQWVTHDVKANLETAVAYAETCVDGNIDSAYSSLNSAYSTFRNNMRPGYGYNNGYPNNGNNNGNGYWYNGIWYPGNSNGNNGGYWYNGVWYPGNSNGYLDNGYWYNGVYYDYNSIYNNNNNNSTGYWYNGIWYPTSTTSQTNNLITETPTTNVKTGAVDYGTTVTLSCESGATIHYTTDGSTPTTNSSIYSKPIVIDAPTTLKFIAVKSGKNNSQVKTLKYTINELVTFTDIKNYTGLRDDLRILIREGIVENGNHFYPSEAVTLENLYTYFDKLNLKVPNEKLDLLDVTLSTELTYEDFCYIVYKTLYYNGEVKTPATSKNINKLENAANITDATIYRAAFAMFIEKDLLRKYDFEPQGLITRADVATAFAGIVDFVR